MNRMTSDTIKHKVDLSVGDLVLIADGPFKDLEGKVGEVDEESGKVKVLVSMFGRETPVELDFSAGKESVKRPKLANRFVATRDQLSLGSCPTRAERR